MISKIALSGAIGALAAEPPRKVTTKDVTEELFDADVGGAHKDRKHGPIVALRINSGTVQLGDLICFASNDEDGEASCGKATGIEINGNNTKGAKAGDKISIQIEGLDSMPESGYIAYIEGEDEDEEDEVVLDEESSTEEGSDEESLSEEGSDADSVKPTFRGSKVSKALGKYGLRMNRDDTVLLTGAIASVSDVVLSVSASLAGKGRTISSRHIISAVAAETGIRMSGTKSYSFLQDRRSRKNKKYGSYSAEPSYGKGKKPSRELVRSRSPARKSVSPRSPLKSAKKSVSPRESAKKSVSPSKAAKKSVSRRKSARKSKKRAVRRRTGKKSKKSKSAGRRRTGKKSKKSKSAGRRRNGKNSTSRRRRSKRTQSKKLTNYKKGIRQLIGNHNVRITTSALESMNIFVNTLIHRLFTEAAKKFDGTINSKEISMVGMWLLHEKLRAQSAWSRAMTPAKTNIKVVVV